MNKFLKPLLTIWRSGFIIDTTHEQLFICLNETEYTIVEGE